MQCARYCLVLVKSSMQRPQRSKTYHGSHTQTMHQLIHSYFFSLLHELFSFTRLLSIPLFPHSFVRLYIHPSTDSFNHFLIHLLILLSLHATIHPFIHPFTHSFSHQPCMHPFVLQCLSAQPQQPSSKNWTVLRFATCY